MSAPEVKNRLGIYAIYEGELPERGRLEDINAEFMRDLLRRYEEEQDRQRGLTWNVNR